MKQLIKIENPNEEYEHSYYANSILSHNTICSSIFILHYLIFNYDKNCLLSGNVWKTSKEIRDKIADIYAELPFWLKPGLLKNNVVDMKFDNNCRLITATATKRSAIGFTIDLLYLDEFAHIEKNIIDDFYENIFPTVASKTESKVIVTSTPNGFNKFYDIYHAAEQGKSAYKHFRVDWWQVPGRDEAWKEREIANLGGIENFNRQHGNSFATSTELLLSPENLDTLERGQIEYDHPSLPIFELVDVSYKGLKFKRGFEMSNFKNPNKYWLFSVDIAEGKKKDYSVINMFEVEMMPKEDRDALINVDSYYDYFRLNQVGIFADNECTVENLAKILYILVFVFGRPDNIKIIVEWNKNFGIELYLRLQHVFEKRNRFDGSCILRFKHSADAKYPEKGLLLNSANKIAFCETCRKMITERRMIITEQDTIKEFTLFTRKDNGSYEAQVGHDDHAMTCVDACAFYNTSAYKGICDEIYLKQSAEETKSINESIDASVNSSYADSFWNDDAYPEHYDDSFRVSDSWFGVEDMDPYKDSFNDSNGYDSDSSDIENIDYNPWK